MLLLLLIVGVLSLDKRQKLIRDVSRHSILVVLQAVRTYFPGLPNSTKFAIIRIAVIPFLILLLCIPDEAREVDEPRVGTSARLVTSQALRLLGFVFLAYPAFGRSKLCDSFVADARGASPLMEHHVPLFVVKALFGKLQCVCSTDLHR